jgi:hypothetical protein
MVRTRRVQGQTRHTFEYIWGINFIRVPLLRNRNLRANLCKVCPRGEVVYAVRHYHQELWKCSLLDSLQWAERSRTTYVLYLILQLGNAVHMS